jgi:glycosyltransferase involved in cell wall biosynthesis
MSGDTALAEAAPAVSRAPGSLAGRRMALVGPLPPPAGGMANQTRQLAALLAGEGLAVEIVRTNEPPPGWLRKVRGVRGAVVAARFLPRLYRAVQGADCVHLMANSWWGFHLFATPTVRIARRLGKPVVLNYRGGEAADFFARQFRWVAPTLRAADRVVVPSGFLEEVFAGFGVATTIVPNVVDLDHFSPAPVPAEELHLLVARSLEPLYGIDTALRACGLLHGRGVPVRLTVAGAGPEAASLRSLAGELGIDRQVRFAGHVDNAAMGQLYRATRIALNPSRADNMPISILEAMACGVPVVSTRVGGVPYLVADGRTALLVPPDDAVAMAEAVLRLHTDAAGYRQMREAGLQAVKQYTWQEVRGRLFAVYSSLLPAG